MTRIRVVGAGLSGLSAAWFLAERGMTVEVSEAGESAGGFIQTVRLPEGPVEIGANAFVWTPAVARLFAALDIEPLFARDASRRRYVFRYGRARRWPLTPVETLGTLARAGWSYTRRATRALPDESVDDWGRRVLGDAATEWLIAPALQGVYGAALTELSAATLGRARRGGRIRLAAPRYGMGALIDALKQRLDDRGVTFRFGQHVSGLEPGAPVVVCANATAAAPLLMPHHPQLAQAAARIRSAPLVTATAFFEPHADDLRGFGVLFPRGTARALGVLFNTEIFEDRGTLRSERWIFGDAALLPGGRELIARAILDDRERLTGRRGAIHALHVQGWNGALPIYDRAIIEAADAAAALPDWLGVCGNYLGRIGVSALVERAENEAARICAALQG